jgi:hypothetical protein
MRSKKNAQEDVISFSLFVSFPFSPMGPKENAQADVNIPFFLSFFVSFTFSVIGAHLCMGWIYTAQICTHTFPILKEKKEMKTIDLQSPIVHTRLTQMDRQICFSALRAKQSQSPKSSNLHHTRVYE